MAKKSSTVYIEENFWDMISKFQAERDLSSRNDAIQVILSEWNILKQIDFNNIQVNVTLGDVSQVAKQVKNTEQIEEDEAIASELSIINVSGTKITKKMIVVPIENTILYVEPVYQTMLNEKSDIPVLKKVIVASGKYPLAFNIIGRYRSRPIIIFQILLHILVMLLYKLLILVYTYLFQFFLLFQL